MSKKLLPNRISKTVAPTAESEFPLALNVMMRLLGEDTPISARPCFFVLFTILYGNLLAQRYPIQAFADDKNQILNLTNRHLL
jgi:hypothetical protein